ncbi:thiol-disulfide oxidoreductase DCC family protein [Deinococcus peraridilitoris]|uniref:thiol-disulfide oxidoreductase DCC family protein n=1 Tax=Deinococcus peraridilitoris TaxID=432329 RepID=UPI001C26EA89|nr:thiol-disulfide oxidoreductase DCC family protein [Deinococcus peraridilitoris]
MKAVVLFDGVCNLCHASVQFLLRRDVRGELRFASLQSRVGRELLACHGVAADLHSVVLIDHGQAYQESDAVVHLARRLPFPWRLAWGLRVIPRPLRDAVYRLVAAHRYRIFGRTERCLVPEANWHDRFLND